MRELTSFELALVSGGGSGSCEHSGGEEYDGCIIGTPPPDLPNYPPSPPPPPSYEPPPYEGGGGGGGDVDIAGDPCPTSRAEAYEALSNLATGSPSAAPYIAAARAAGLDIVLNRDHFVSFNPTGNYIAWDPFSAASGQNRDGSYWVESPTLGLIHEIIHWHAPTMSHDDVYTLVNQIARELNTNTGSSNSANRSSVGGSTFLVNDTDSVEWDLANQRPGCGT